MRSRLAFAVALAFAAVGLATPVLAQKQGGTLRIYHRSNPPSASIHEEATIYTVRRSWGCSITSSSTTRAKPLNTPETIVPDLADSWAWDATNTKLTFKLHQGVKWHDGKPFTAKDVQCTWNKLTGKDPDDFRKNPRAIWWHNLKEVTVNGDLRGHLRPQPAAALVPLAVRLGLHAGLSLPRVDQGHAHQPDRHRAVQVRRVQARRVGEVGAQPDYWKKGKPYLDAIEWKVIENRSTRILAFVAGEFDMTFRTDVTIPLLKDVTSQAPKAVCEVAPTLRLDQPDRQSRLPRPSTIRRSARRWR